jgi:hypothetical protein
MVKNLKSKGALVLLAIAALGFSAFPSIQVSANVKTCQNYSMSSLEETHVSVFSNDSNPMEFILYQRIAEGFSRKHIDPELFNATGPTRVLIIADDSLPLKNIAEYMMSSRATPSLKGYYIIRGTMQADQVKQLSDDPRILTVLEDRKVEYSVPTEFPTLSSIKEAFNHKTAEFGQYARESFLGKPETTLREVVNITGARDVWETYDINGTDTTIAIVDTGVDYGALSLGYWDIMAKDLLGFPAAFDADGECMAFTTIALSAYTTSMGDFIPTLYMDPFIYGIKDGFLVPGGVCTFSELTYYLFGVPMLWPGDMNVTGIVSQSGVYHFGIMFQYLFGADIFPVLVVDSTTAGVYDTAYVDLSFDWAWLSYIYGLPFGTWPPDFSFADESPITPDGTTIAARDFTGDGIYDLSVGSLGYFLDVWGLSPNPDDRGLVLKPVAEDGDYVVFVNDWWGHGTSCASCALGRDVEHPLVGPGIAPGAKVMSITALFIGDIIEGELWAAGFDLIPGTEGWKNITGYGTVWGSWNYTGNHKADIISNSWGASNWAEWSATLGFPWYDVLTAFEDALTVPGYLHPEYPGTMIVHAGGNGGAGYGTFTEPGYGTLPIGVGASTSLNWTKYQFGFAGGTYDDVIPWSARGPTPLGNVKPDVVNVGAFGWTAAPVWYGFGDGSVAFDLFGGTSMATPLTAGASALIIQAYNEAKGRKPTPEAAKVILKSSAKDLGYDAFVQGAGRVDAFAAVELACGSSGVSVFSPASWDNIRSRIENAWSMSYMSLGEPLLFDPPTGLINDVNWFAGAVQPGSSASAQFTIENVATQPVTVNITSVKHKQIGTTQTYSGYTGELALGWQIWDWYWGDLTALNLTDIPDKTELMIVSLTVPYEYFDQNEDYLWNRRWGLCILDWVDDGNGEIEINEVYLLNYGYNVGTSNEARVGFPLSKINGRPVIFTYQRGIEDSVPFDVDIKYYERSNWRWVNTPATVAVAENSSETFIATLTVPADTAQGVYQGQIKIDISGSYNRTLTVPVSLQVPTILSTDDLVYDLTPPSEIELYDSYSVNGYFDWGWRYEAGDWKQWLFNIQDPSVVAAFVSCSWIGDMTDIDMFGIDPTGAIVDGAMSPNPYDDGLFLWSTRTGTTEEFAFLPTSPMGKTITGLYTVLLHNVLFSGTAFPEAISGKVELVKLEPSGPISLTTSSGHSTSQTFTITTGRKLTNVMVQPSSHFLTEITPGIILGINATDSAEFNVRIDVPEDALEGTYPVFIDLMSDESSQPVTILINVSVDNTLPTVNVISPKNGSVLSGNVLIEAYAYDPGGIKKVEFKAETTSYQMNFDNKSGHWIGTLDTTTLSDGMYTTRITAHDKAGNTGSTSVSFTLDKTPPIVTIAYPTNGSYISVSTAWINGTIAEHNKGSMSPSINDPRFSLAYWDTVTGAFAFKNTSYISDGSSIMAMVRFVDQAENIGNQLIFFTLDTTPPTMTITYPTRGAHIRGSAIWMNGTVTELYKGALEPFINATRLSLTYWSPLSGDFAFCNNTAIPDGPLSVEVSFTDLAGNSVANTVTMIVDNTKPSVSITNPEYGAELSGTVDIDFTAEDIFLDKTVLYIDQASFTVTGEASYEWDTTMVGDGTHTMKLVAFDKAGNTKETAITVTTTNVEKAMQESYEEGYTSGEEAGYILGRNLGLAIGASLGLVAGAIGVYAITRKRSKHPSTRPPQKES